MSYRPKAFGANEPTGAFWANPSSYPEKMMAFGLFFLRVSSARLAGRRPLGNGGGAFPHAYFRFSTFPRAARSNSASVGRRPPNHSQKADAPASGTNTI